MPEQQPLRICVICLHKARSLQDNREREKKVDRGNRQLLVESWNRWEIFYSSGYSSSRLDGEGPLGNAHGEQVLVSCTTLINFLNNYH